jgi:hypothetical protein
MIRLLNLLGKEKNPSISTKAQTQKLLSKSTVSNPSKRRRVYSTEVIKSPSLPNETQDT